MLFIIKATNFCTLNMDLENTSALFIGRTFVFIFLKIILLLVSIAYFTLAERKIMGSIQRRRGPNVVGFWGLLQPLADGLKLFSKQMLIPSKANSNMFVLSPLLILTFSLLTWVIVPFDLVDTCNTLGFVAQKSHKHGFLCYTLTFGFAIACPSAFVIFGPNVGCKIAAKIFGENLVWSSNFIQEGNFVINISSNILILLIVSLIIVYLIIGLHKKDISVLKKNWLDVIDFWGLLQPQVDRLKLLLKQMLIILMNNHNLHVWLGFLLLTCHLLALVFICFDVLDPCPCDVLSFAADNTNQSQSSQSSQPPQNPHEHSYLCQGIAVGLMVACPLVFLASEVAGYNLACKMADKSTQIAHKIADKVLGENLVWSSNFFQEWNFIANIPSGLLFLLAVSSILVYLFIIGGWASNSKYSFLGALRSAAQMVSYEVSISLVIIPVVLLAGTLNLTEIVISQAKTVWYLFPLLPCAIIFLISMLAETNRAPFDLPEAEAELVAGYNTEYSSIEFAMFFLGEYCNMILMSSLMILIFIGGWLIYKLLVKWIIPSFVFSSKTSTICFFFVLVRAAYPRYRYDQLMEIGWKKFLPITLGFLIFISGIFMIFRAGVYVYEVLPRCFSSSILIPNIVIAY